MNHSTPLPNKRHRSIGMPESSGAGGNQPAASSSLVNHVGCPSVEMNLNMSNMSDVSGLDPHLVHDRHHGFGLSRPTAYTNIAGSTSSPFLVNQNPASGMPNAQAKKEWGQFAAGQNAEQTNMLHRHQMDQSPMSSINQPVAFENNMHQLQSQHQSLTGQNLTPIANQMHAQGLVPYDHGQARESSYSLDTASVASSSAGSSSSISQYAAASPTSSQSDTASPAVGTAEASNTAKTKREYIIVGEVEQAWINDILDYEKSSKNLPREEYYNRIGAIMSNGRVCDYIKIDNPDANERINHYLVIENPEDLGKAKKRKRSREDDGTLMVKRKSPVPEELENQAKAKARFNLGSKIIRTDNMTAQEIKEVHDHNRKVADVAEAWRLYKNRLSAKNCRIRKDNKIDQLAEANAVLQAKLAFTEALLFCLCGIDNLWRNMPDVEMENFVGDYRFNPRD